MATETLTKTYDPHTLEQQIYQNWEQAGYFAASGNTGASYCIMIPPPNVTGSLHMGHAFQDTLMDTLIRYHRMCGRNTLWQAGMDHAGIATQMVVERQLELEGKTRHDLGREAFIDRVWEWKRQSGGTINQQLRRMGASLDWSRERFTMDEGLSRAVVEVFVRLYEEDLIYRGKRLVNWDPVLHTAVSDLEVVAEEEAGHLWHMRYPLADGDGHVVVATTRPETMLGDTAVAVHPDDDRYRSLIGKTVLLPLADREIPIIADDYVDPEFGSGCVKITPAHDFNDYEVWQRHKNNPQIKNQRGKGLINIFTKDAKIKSSEMDDFEFDHKAQDGKGNVWSDRGVTEITADLIPEKYRGLDRYDARKQIIKDLQAEDLLEKIDDHTLMVPRGDRSGAVVEPYLTDQWFVRAGPLAAPAIAAVEQGRIRFVPENWAKTYFEWMRNIQDWCISRQIWWGHRIPAWYDGDGQIYVARTEAEARQQAHKKHGKTVKLRQDDDVLDTWFSSALWPFSTLGWPENTSELKTFYPTNVLVTGFDIIFFWVARMIMMGLKFMGDVPFHEVYIHGLVRDAHGQKMSKSKGNILDPLDLINSIDLETLVQKRTSGLMQPQMANRIEQATRQEFPDGIPAFGTDALRFTFAALATTGRNISFDLHRITGYRNFCNKLWNAARYVLMNMEPGDDGQDGAIELSVADRWIVARLQQVEQEIHRAIKDYRLDLMAQTLYSFIWDEYCSWYLELSKPVLTSGASTAAARRGTRQTLIQVLEALLRLLHPITPYITETIWQKVAPIANIRGETIMLQPYPMPDASLIDADAIDEMQWVMTVITAIRNIRGEMDINPGQRIPVLLQHGADNDHRYLKAHEDTMMALAKLTSITWLETDTTAPDAATALVGDMHILIPLAGLIDKAAEESRLQKDIGKYRQELQCAEAKLSNSNFIERAPKEVVKQEKDRVTKFETAIRDLTEQLEKIRALTG